MSPFLFEHAINPSSAQSRPGILYERTLQVSYDLVKCVRPQLWMAMRGVASGEVRFFGRCFHFFSTISISANFIFGRPPSSCMSSAVYRGGVSSSGDLDYGLASKVARRLAPTLMLSPVHSWPGLVHSCAPPGGRRRNHTSCVRILIPHSHRAFELMGFHRSLTHEEVRRLPLPRVDKAKSCWLRFSLKIL